MPEFASIIEVMLLVCARLDDTDDAVSCLEPDHQVQSFFPPVFSLAGVYSPLPGKALLSVLVLNGVALAAVSASLVDAERGKRSGSRQSCSPMIKSSAALVVVGVDAVDFVLMGFLSSYQ